MSKPKAPIERMLDDVIWTPLPGTCPAEGGMPYATHAGLLRIADLEIPVVQLNTGQRLVTEEGMRMFFAWLGGGAGETE